MKEAVICLSVYLGSLFLLSLVGKETPYTPPSQVCVGRYTPKGPSDESPKQVNKDCASNTPQVPKKPKVEK